jgi:hypothetical protein
MELTIDQNSTLHVAGKRIAQKRRAFLQRSRAAADKQSPKIRYGSFIKNLIGRRYHPDNGR